MSNHYDPSDGRMDYTTARGDKMKLAISGKPGWRIADDVDYVQKTLTNVEKSVLGGDAIDQLRSAKEAIAKLFRDA